MPRSLTVLQARFLAAYLNEAHFNATEAARIAGYRGNRATLATIGSKTRRAPQVAAEIQADLDRFCREQQEREQARLAGILRSRRW